jgi:hypothetical protein
MPFYFNFSALFKNVKFISHFLAVIIIYGIYGIPGVPGSGDRDKK